MSGADLDLAAGWGARILAAQGCGKYKLQKEINNKNRFDKCILTISYSTVQPQRAAHASRKGIFDLQQKTKH